MAHWQSKPISIADGHEHTAIHPIVISASRATDIPAFYGSWFINRLHAGFSVWKNPFSGQEQYVSFTQTRVIIFWTKNPEPFISQLPILNELGFNYYFLFTLNSYNEELIELNVPKLEKRIETFIKLSELIGKEKVLWRFDPILLSKTISIDKLLQKINLLGNILCKHSNKLIFSFIEIEKYKKVKNSIARYNPSIRELTEAEKHRTIVYLSNCLKTWKILNPKFSIATCGLNADYKQFDIEKNACIDYTLLQKLFPHDTLLQSYIQSTIHKKDRGQRKDCNCGASKDIGTYNSCSHGCIYCYANASIESSQANYKLHNVNNVSIVL